MPLYGAATEYALHTVLNLGLATGTAAPSARDLADFQRLPVAFMRKLLTRLEKSGIVAASEGVRGGWRLARPLADISMLDVADAAQGREPLFECREIRANCALWPQGTRPAARPGELCTIHAAMRDAEAAMRQHLAGRSLAAIAAEVARKSPQWARQDLPAWFSTRIATRLSIPEPQE
jgi:Rrf2 family protein